MVTEFPLLSITAARVESSGVTIVRVLARVRSPVAWSVPWPVNVSGPPSPKAESAPVASVPPPIVVPPWKILSPVEEQHAAAVRAAIHDGDAARRTAGIAGPNGGIDLKGIAIRIEACPACANVDLLAGWNGQIPRHLQPPRQRSGPRLPRLDVRWRQRIRR